MRIVIAEDDVDTRALIKAALRPLDCELRETGSGLELLEAIAFEGPFDLIVTDLAMPHIDGVRVLAMLRNAGMNTPAILVTAYGPQDVQDDGKTGDLLGNVHLMRKPFGLSALRRVASSLLPAET